MAKKDNAETVAEPPSGTFGELKLMVTDYAKQQTVEPLKNLGLWAGFGVAGAVFLVIGSFLTGLGILRGLQKVDWVSEDRSWLPDDLTFLPYLIFFVLLLGAAGLCFFAMTKTPEWMDDDE